MTHGTSTTGPAPNANRPGPRRIYVATLAFLLAAFWIFIEWKTLESFHFATKFGAIWGVADDVYISADFGRTLAEGGGPRWFPGAPKVEGFTSPAWILVLAVLHLFPSLTGRQLGLTVFAVNAALLFGIALTSLRIVVAMSGKSATATKALFLGFPIIAVSGVALAFWTGEGFETALVAFVSLWAFHSALAGEQPKIWHTGTITALALWTRLDAALYCGLPLLGAAFGWTTERRVLRPRVAFIAIPLASISVQILARLAYYGEPLPNTYYLKATGWPYHDRLFQGWLQNGPDLFALIVLLTPLSILSLSHIEGVVRRRVAIGLAVFAFSVCYSTFVGGDLAYEAFGYDRFTCVGALFLSVSLPALAVAPKFHARMPRTLASIGAVVAAIAPVALRPNLNGRVAWRQMPLWTNIVDFEAPLVTKDTLVLTWIHYGFAIDAITDPGARVALCAAGAPVYFSRRPAVDILGKIDKHVARLPVPAKAPPDARCWRGFPGVGHNKEDVRWTFAAYHPELSLVPPPSTDAAHYVTMSYDGLTVWARRGVERVLWTRLRHPRDGR